MEAREKSARGHRSSIVGTLFIAICAVSAPAQSTYPKHAQIDALFAEFDRPDSPGCALGIVEGGRLVYERGYGLASIEHQVPISATTTFYIASTSKQFTAASIVLLASQGRLSLDDDIRKYVPEIPEYARPITIRHLLHHTSGLRDYLTLRSLAGQPHENIFGDAEQLALLARQQETNFAAGDEFAYSNSGYALLAQIVKRVAKQPLSAYAEENIFKPLGMSDTHFHDDARMVVPRRAVGYERAGVGWRLDFLVHFDRVGDGGLHTTVRDLAKWDANFYDPRVGGRSLVDQLLTRGVLSNGDTIPYALGLVHASHRGIPLVGHNGGFMGYRSDFVRFPTQRLTIVTLCNTSTANPTLIARRIASLLLEGRVPLLPEPPPPSPVRPPTATTIALSAEELASYSGTYFSAELNATYELAAQDGQLVAVRGPMQRLRAVPIARDRFRAETGPTFQFVRDGSRITGFSLTTFPARNIRFVRQH